MSLYDDPSHTITIYGPPVATTDSAGGEVITWPTVRAASVPCILNPTGASEQERFGQTGIVRSFTVSILTELASPERGDKLIDSDGLQHHVKSIKVGLAYGNIPRLTYMDTEVWT